MSIHLERVEGFAELFHHYYTALAPDFAGDEQREAEWRDLTVNERRRFIAATRLALIEADSGPSNGKLSAAEPPYRGTEGRECGC